MATVTNKRKVLSIEGKVKVLQQIENGKKKADVCREFGLINSTIQMIWKTEPELLVRLKRSDQE
jgi:transposase-like protein